MVAMKKRDAAAIAVEDGSQQTVKGFTFDTIKNLCNIHSEPIWSCDWGRRVSVTVGIEEREIRRKKKPKPSPSPPPPAVVPSPSPSPEPPKEAAEVLGSPLSSSSREGSPKSPPAGGGSGQDSASRSPKSPSASPRPKDDQPAVPSPAQSPAAGGGVRESPPPSPPSGSATEGAMDQTSPLSSPSPQPEAGGQQEMMQFDGETDEYDPVSAPLVDPDEDEWEEEEVLVGEKRIEWHPGDEDSVLDGIIPEPKDQDTRTLFKQVLRFALRDSEESPVDPEELRDLRLPDGYRLIEKRTTDYIVTGGLDNVIKVWSFEEDVLKPLHELEGHSLGLVSVAISPDGRWLASSSMDSLVRIWDIQTGESTTSIDAISLGSWTVCWSPDSRLIASGNPHGSITVWTAKTGSKEAVLETRGRFTLSLVWSPNGRYVASGAIDGFINIFDWKTKDLVHTLESHAMPIRCLSFSHDSRFLISASDDGAMKLYETEKAEFTASFPGHAGWVLSVHFNPTGRYFASSSADHTVKIWDTEEKECLFTFEGDIGHKDQVWSVRWNPDGDRLVSVSEDRAVHVYQAQREGSGSKLVQTRRDLSHLIPPPPPVSSEPLPTLTEDVDMIPLSESTAHMRSRMSAIISAPAETYDGTTQRKTVPPVPLTEGRYPVEEMEKEGVRYYPEDPTPEVKALMSGDGALAHGLPPEEAEPGAEGGASAQPITADSLFGEDEDLSD